MTDGSKPRTSEATKPSGPNGGVDVRSERTERQGRVTLRDVARAAGVAPSTVSRVLGGVTTSVAITEATRQLVNLKARELGYRPHPLARGLQGSKTGLIGLIVRDLAYPLHAPLIEHVVEAIRSQDHHVVMGSSHESTSESSQIEHIIHTQMCDGILMIGGLDDRAGVVDELREARMPTVGIGLAITDEGIPVVRGDNATGGRLVFEHLDAHGHRQVALLQTGEHPELRDRADSFMAAAKAGGWPAGSIRRVLVENDPAAAAAAFRSLLDGGRPTAVFVTTDHAAFGVLAEAARMGIEVPRELSIVGYDDLAMSETVFPPLTTVRQDLRLLAERAVSSVFGIIRTGERPADAGDLVPVALTVRASTGPPEHVQ
jgi:DNA-binding LacI/PurR family transcriptional regulator